MDHPHILGHLAISIKSATRLGSDIMIDDPANPEQPQAVPGTLVTTMYVIVTLRDQVKRTRVGRVSGRNVVWDQTKFFTTPLVRQTRHPFNLVRIQLMAMLGSDLGGGHVELGSVAFHLHHVVDACPLAGVFALYKGHHLAAELDLAVEFRYGSFGYGYSSQLRSTKLPAEMVKGCILPRSQPPADRTDEHSGLLVPKAVAPPAILGIDTPAALQCAEDVVVEEANPAAYPVLRSRMDRYQSLLEQMNGFSQGKERRARLLFLEGLVMASAVQAEIVVVAEAKNRSTKASYRNFAKPAKLAMEMGMSGSSTALLAGAAGASGAAGGGGGGGSVGAAGAAGAASSAGGDHPSPPGNVGAIPSLMPTNDRAKKTGSQPSALLRTGSFYTSVRSAASLHGDGEGPAGPEKTLHLSLGKTKPAARTLRRSTTAGIKPDMS